MDENDPKQRRCNVMTVMPAARCRQAPGGTAGGTAGSTAGGAAGGTTVGFITARTVWIICRPGVFGIVRFRSNTNQPNFKPLNIT